MRGIEDPTRTKRYSFLTALLINALFLALVRLCFYAGFESSDDQYMNMLLCGTFNGRPTPFALFINLAISYPLERLIVARPDIPWYVLAEYVALFAAFTGASYAMIRKDRRSGSLFALLILASFGFDCYTQLNFTKVAGAAAAGGALLIVDALYRKKARVVEALAGALIFTVGSLYRFKMAIAVLGMMSPLLLFVAIRLLRRRDYGRFWRGAAWLGATALVCVGLYVANGIAYSRTTGWAEYRQYNRDRSLLLDRAFPDYEENAELYATLGFSEQDLAYYKSWSFADTARFTPESVHMLAEAFEGPEIDEDFWHTLGEEIPAGYLKYAWIPAFLIAAALAVYASRRNIPYLILAILLLAAFSAFLLYYQRYLRSRVDICAFLALTLSLLSLSQQSMRADALPSGKGYALCACLALLIFVPSIAAYGYNYIDVDETIAENRETFDIIRADDAHTYLIDLRAGGLARYAFKTSEPYPAGSAENMVCTGGWQVFSPVWYQQIARRGIKNPFSDCIDNDGVFYLDNRHIADTVKYIQRHYDGKATSTLAKVINGNRIYRITSGGARPAIEGEIIDALPENLRVEDVLYSRADKKLTVSGNVFMEGASSYQGEAWLELVRDDGRVYYQLMTQHEVERADPDEAPVGDLHGQFSRYTGSRSASEDRSWQVSILYRSEGVWYRAYRFEL